MNIKMIVCDMDGTLLNSELKISPYTSRVIKEAINQDIIFVVASGRSHYMMDDYYKELGMNHKTQSYMIGLNGVELYSFKENKINRKTAFSKQDACEIGQTLLDRQMIPVLMYYDKTIIISDNDENQAIQLKNVLESNYKGAFAKIQISKLCEIPNEYLDKVCIISDIQTIKDKIDFLQKNLENKVDIYHVGDEWIELVSKGISKANRLKELMELENIHSDELLIFGDSQNDVGMFELSQYSFVMENARTEIKQKAKYIAESNDNHGVAKAIVRLLGLKVNI